MGKILTLSGKKQSGKNTSANFLFGLVMSTIRNENAESEFISDFHINERGELMIPYAGEKEGEIFYAQFDPLTRATAIREFLADNLWCHIKIYSFADKLKEFAIDVLGLTEQQCYGTDEDKNSLVPHLLWENMPGYCNRLTAQQILSDIGGDGSKTEHLLLYNQLNIFISDKKGSMTAREVLQYFGTDIGRRMYNNVWVDATFRQIEKDDPAIAIICDGRFPNEIDGTQKRGGKVIRFTRNPNPNDKHFSELALDPDKYDQSKFDFLCDNSEMSIDQQNEAVYSKLLEWGWLEKTE